MITQGLAYVTLVVDDVEAVSTVFAQLFGLPQGHSVCGAGPRTVPTFRLGQTTLVVCGLGDSFVEGHDRPGVHHIALAADDPRAAAHTAYEVGLALVDQAPSDSLDGGVRVLLAPASTGGIRTYLASPLAPGPGGSNVIERLDHLGVASADCDGTLDAFVNRLGLPWEDTETDMESVVAVETFVSKKYGITQITRPPRLVASVRAEFITVGDCELEVIQDIDPENAGHVQHGTAGTTAQDKGAIAKYVQRRGPGLHHVAFKVSDINRSLAALGDAGLRLIDTVGRPGGRRSQIGFIHPQSVGGVLTHLVERDAP
jgi:catechol 2,3-dioxygenase-like lactoylglutathione lyase family enzyme